MIFPLNSALIGPASERPDPNDPKIPRNGSTPPIYICIDTLDVFQDVGRGWLLVGSIGGTSLPGVTSDGQNGIVVQKRIRSDSISAGTLFSDSSGAFSLANTTGNIFPYREQSADLNLANIGALYLYGRDYGSALAESTSNNDDPDGSVSLPALSSDHPSIFAWRMPVVPSPWFDIVFVRLQAILPVTTDYSDLNFVFHIYGANSDGTIDPTNDQAFQIGSGDQMSADQDSFGNVQITVGAQCMVDFPHGCWLALHIYNFGAIAPGMDVARLGTLSGHTGSLATSTDGGTTWTTSTGTLPCFEVRRYIETIINAANVIGGVGEFDHPAPATAPDITGNVTTGDLAALQTVVGQLLTALDAKGSITKSTS